MADRVYVESERPVRETRVEEAEVRGEVFLQPIAAPSILGLFGLAGSTFMVSAYMANWYGTADSLMLLFPFVALFGGLAQFLAGMWAYKARDGLATVVHGTWGSFWMAYGFLFFLQTLGYVVIPQKVGGIVFQEMAMFFIVLAVTTWACTWAAMAENMGMVLFLGFLALGSTLAAIGYMWGLNDVLLAAAYSLAVSAIIAWYTGTALMLESAFGREVLSLGKFSRAVEKPKFDLAISEPGVQHGQ